MAQDVELHKLDHVEPAPTMALRKPPREVKLPSVRGPGRSAYGDKALQPYLTQPLAEKGRISRNTWADTAYVLVLRAKSLSQTVSKKDFNALYRLILSAGIAFDKAWPTQLPVSSGNLVVQLFGSLPSVELRSILQPAVPVIQPTPAVEDAVIVESTDSTPT